MSAAVEKAAEVLWNAIDNKGIKGRLYREDCDYLAEALAAANLLAGAEDRDRDEGGARQRRYYLGEKEAGWDPADANTFAEECAHLHEEVSEAFRQWRVRKDCEVVTDTNGKPQGVPVEFADVLLGMYYIAERWGFDLDAATEAKHQFNLTRSYATEGRRLHEPAQPAATDTRKALLREAVEALDAVERRVALTAATTKDALRIIREERRRVLGLDNPEAREAARASLAAADARRAAAADPGEDELQRQPQDATKPALELERRPTPGGAAGDVDTVAGVLSRVRIDSDQGVLIAAAEISEWLRPLAAAIVDAQDGGREG